MSIPDQTKAASDLAPYLGRIRQFSQKAWDYYHGELPPMAQLVFGARSRASNVHDLMVHFASEFAADTPDAQPFERLQMQGIVLLKKYAIRFKKLDEGNKSKNQPSAQVKLYREQVELEGIDALHNLELGYILDKWQQKIVDVRLVCPSGEGTAWALSLMDDEDAKATETNIFEISTDNATEEVKPAEIAPAKEADVLPFVRKKESAD